MQNTLSAEFPLFSAADLTQRRHGLIKKGKSENGADVIEKQFALAQAAERSTQAFIDWFDGIAIESRSQALSFRPKTQPLTGQEIANPPIDTERDHYNILKDLPPRLAALPSFWTSYQLKMIRLGLFDPADLATPIGTTKETGRACLQKAIRRTKKTLLDQCTRTILRQLGGLPEVRGYVTIFVDCRLSRAWWRGHLSHQVAEDISLGIEDVWAHLRLPNATWDELQQYTVKRLTVVGDRSVRSAVVARLMESGIEKDSSTIRRQRTQAFLGKVGARCAYQALGILSPKQNLAAFREMEV